MKSFALIFFIAASLAAPTNYFPVATAPAADFFWQLPSNADGLLPQRLSQTGAFNDLQHLVPDKNLIPYALNVSFWSDGADKTRFASVPTHQKIKFAATGEWRFPRGTVLVKTFELATDETNPTVKRRLETRLLVRDDHDGVYGVTYKWRADNSDADLLETNLTEDILIKTANGTRTQAWYYPSRADCLTCHTANAGYVLGVTTRQLNRDFTYPDGLTENQLLAWNHLGWFTNNFTREETKSFPTLAASDDLTHSLTERARSYLDANCAHCHRPKGTVGFFDARYETPLAQQNLIGGRVLINQRIDGARVIAPHDPWRSILFMRANTVEPFKMPPLGRNTVDERSMKLLRAWIENLPGPTVLPPPEITPVGGKYSQPIEVILTGEPGATIRYTVDGTVPTVDDLLYEKPIKLTEPTIVRAKTFKPECTKSITIQAIYLFGE